MVNQRAFSRRSNPLFPIRADYKIAAPHASRIDILAPADFAAVLCKPSGERDLCGLPHVDGLHGIVGKIERVDAKQIGSVVLQKRMHGRPLKLVNGLPSVGQSKVEGKVVLVAHRRRIARESRRCKFVPGRDILHHAGVKYIIPLALSALPAAYNSPKPACSSFLLIRKNIQGRRILLVSINSVKFKIVIRSIKPLKSCWQ